MLDANDALVERVRNTAAQHRVEIAGYTDFTGGLMRMEGIHRTDRRSAPALNPRVTKVAGAFLLGEPISLRRLEPSRGRGIARAMSPTEAGRGRPGSREDIGIIDGT
ncbi:MAG: hypothetical protein IT578_00015 [Verrucomicrobiae bacterium]|nr:hypothetical protein [Verrucomicrobiae bacterium]